MCKVADVDDGVSVDAEKVVLGDCLFNLPQLHTYDLFVPIGEVDIRIIAVGFDENDFIRLICNKTALMSEDYLFWRFSLLNCILGIFSEIIIQTPYSVALQGVLQFSSRNRFQQIIKSCCFDCINGIFFIAGGEILQVNIK
jgi:hypothetical protein